MIEIFDGLEINENFDGIKIQKTMNSRLIKTEQDNCHFDFKLVFSTGFANQYQVNPTIDYDGDIIFLVCAKIREKAIIICQMSLDLIIYTFDEGWSWSVKTDCHYLTHTQNNIYYWYYRNPTSIKDMDDIQHSNFELAPQIFVDIYGHISDQNTKLINIQPYHFYPEITLLTLDHLYISYVYGGPADIRLWCGLNLKSKSVITEIPYHQSNCQYDSCCYHNDGGIMPYYYQKTLFIKGLDVRTRAFTHLNLTTAKYLIKSEKCKLKFYLFILKNLACNLNYRCLSKTLFVTQVYPMLMDVNSKIPSCLDF